MPYLTSFTSIIVIIFTMITILSLLWLSFLVWLSYISYNYYQLLYIIIYYILYIIIIIIMITVIIITWHHAIGVFFLGKLNDLHQTAPTKSWSPWAMPCLRWFHGGLPWKGPRLGGKSWCNPIPFKSYPPMNGPNMFKGIGSNTKACLVVIVQRGQGMI